MMSKALILVFCLGALVVAVPGRARAADEEVIYERYHSPQNFALEFRFGPYRPDVDSEFSNGAKPFQTVFGTGSGLLFGIELDYQFFQRFGSLAVGGSIGYASQSAPSLIASDPNQRSAADTTGFRTLPLSLLLIYRFDVMARRWNVPFVPYGKVGLAHYLWWITNSNGDIATAPPGLGGRGLGGTWGGTFALGMALLLDVLEPIAASTMDSELGVNHTYIFFEYDKTIANGIGQTNALHVGDSTWAAGLAFEF